MVANSAQLVAPRAPYLVEISINDLPNVWGAIEPVLRKACEASREQFTVERVLAEMGLHDGVERWKLLAIINGDDVQAVMAVCITLRGAERVLDCVLAGGDHAKEWPLVDDQFDELARDWGCASVRIPHARKGWAKSLPHWRVTGYVMEREV